MRVTPDLTWIGLLLVGWIAGAAVTAGVAWQAYHVLTAQITRMQADLTAERAEYRARVDSIRADRDAAIRYAQDQEAKWQGNFMTAFDIVRKLQSTTAQAVGTATQAVELVGKGSGTGPLDWRALFPPPAQAGLLSVLLTRLDRFGTDEGRTLLLSGLPDEWVSTLRRADTPREDLTAIVEGAARYDLTLLGGVLDNAREVVGAGSQTGAALRAWRDTWHL